MKYLTKVCDVCKMLTKDELTRTLDRYNGSKLKRMYKLTDQDIYKQAKAQDGRIAGWFDVVQEVKAKDGVIAKGTDLAACIQ